MKYQMIMARNLPEEVTQGTLEGDIAPGDIIIALDGVRVKCSNLSELLSRYGEGDEILIHAFRDDSLLAWAVLLGKPKAFLSKVVIKPTKLGRDWLK